MPDIESLNIFVATFSDSGLSIEFGSGVKSDNTYQIELFGGLNVIIKSALVTVLMEIFAKTTINNVNRTIRRG
jgi:hypothetical protein